MSNLKKGRTFGRKSSNRKALFQSLAISLIEHEGIKTTLPKAKELRTFIAVSYTHLTLPTNTPV